MQGQQKVNTHQKNEIIRLHDMGWIWRDIGAELGIAPGTAKTHYRLAVGQDSYPRFPESPYMRYDDPPVVEGDALVLPDVEIPFQYAEFVNRVLDLTDAWGIRQVICAGDLLHMDSISGWEPNWAANPDRTNFTESDEAALIEVARTLPKNKQAVIFEIIGRSSGLDGKDFSAEMGHARRALKSLNDCFDSFVWVLGNHEGRLLRAINSPASPVELLNMMRLDEGKWKIAPYYYCLLNSAGEVYRITHPKSAANGAARGLAAQYHQHIIMGHSHKMFMDWDASGKYYAMQIGHCVDEMRLAYAAQRDAKRDSHKLGAVIIRDGYPYLLHEHLDWERLKRL